MNDIKPSFVDLSVAVDFIVSALATGDHGALADACTASALETDDGPLDEACVKAGLQTPREHRLEAIKALADRHAATSLRSLYVGRVFPARATRLKLGGHAQELGHVHVDFVRSESGWQLENIWQCR